MCVQEAVIDVAGGQADEQYQIKLMLNRAGGGQYNLDSCCINHRTDGTSPGPRSHLGEYSTGLRLGRYPSD